jgi:N-acetylglucosaminyldiphosphoundecaprenol N-acetyl-beta-D-mannosaminyltransferase
MGLPVILMNSVLALLCREPILKHYIQHDCLGRTVHFHTFSRGLFTSMPMLWSVFSKRMSLCGMPIDIALDESQKQRLQRYSHIPAGLFDAVTLHQSSGLATTEKSRLLENQFSASRMAYLSLLVKAFVTKRLYANSQLALKTPDIFQVFGLKINNATMKQAVNWVMSKQKSGVCKTGCFINVNSVNLTAEHPQLRTQLNDSDRCFADGSGIRLAAKSLGFKLRDNVNGTDMLPHLCKAAQAKGKSIYFLGAKPGVARATATNLKQQYPKLRIAGTAHGYFQASEDNAIVDRINHSGADILLLALGSPAQEKWLQNNAKKLSCHTALAVGGLFDFYSGTIARAPMWMRELGMEWVWRLMQEPKAKFHRYVIGNPLFLIRTFVFKSANRGI